MAPPFTGGLMAALIMGEAGNAAGMPGAGNLSSICFIMQGFVGFPLTALFLKKEATRVLGEIDKGSWVVEEKKEESEQKKALVDRVPEKLKGNYWYILELCFYGWIAKLLSDFLNTTFNSTLWSTSITGIVVGILAAALGIIDTSPMNKAQSYGFLNWALTAYFMSFLKTATAQLLLSLVVPLVTGLALATVGIFIGSILLGTSKIVGFSKPMALAVGLNCFLGFPYNFILVKECIASLECSEERKETVENHLMPKMILGSVIAVSIVSVLIAGILAPVVMAMGALTKGSPVFQGFLTTQKPPCVRHGGFSPIPRAGQGAAGFPQSKGGNKRGAHSGGLPGGLQECRPLATAQQAGAVRAKGRAAGGLRQQKAPRPPAEPL